MSDISKTSMDFWTVCNCNKSVGDIFGLPVFLSPELWGSDLSRKNERGHIKWLPILFLLTDICKCTLPATNNFYLANSDQK
jgi:hypothetical protein